MNFLCYGLAQAAAGIAIIAAKNKTQPMAFALCLDAVILTAELLLFR